jgi:hypothetical protein
MADQGKRCERCKGSGRITKPPRRWITYDQPATCPDCHGTGQKQGSDPIRDEAVRRVDQRHGYTVEFASDPEEHRAEYDDEEARLKQGSEGEGARRHG